MTQYTKEFREQAILLSDEIGVKKGSWATRRCLQYTSWLVKTKKHNEKRKTKCFFRVINRTRKTGDERNCKTEGSKWNPKGCNEFFRKRPEKIEACSKFEYIFRFKQRTLECQFKKEYSVKKLCKVLSVSETGFYKWKRNRNKPKAWQLLLQKMYEILDEHPKELCIKAAKEAYKFRKPKSGFLFHSDTGSQYTSLKYKIELGKMHAIQSMSDVGKCYDNCRIESFFATLKKEKLYQLNTMKMTMEEVKTEVWRFVQYYNRTRICTFKGRFSSPFDSPLFRFFKHCRIEIIPHPHIKKTNL